MAYNNGGLYPSTSPYYLTGIFNNKFLDFMENRGFPSFPSDVYYELPKVYEYRPDLLAYDLYNDSRLWGVFAARNPNKLGPDPYFNFIAGINIYIPTADALKQYLGI